jgi:hypothetical protein
MAFAIKAEVCDPRAKTFAFAAQKTMYGSSYPFCGSILLIKQPSES